MDPSESGQSTAERYRTRGWWRDRTFLDDFKEVVDCVPDKVAIVSDHHDGSLDVLSFRQLSRLVDRFAGALLELGIGPRDVVSIQLPNWWQFTALTLATFRIGAIVNPIVPILRHREVAFILERVGSRICVVPDIFRGFAHGEMVADLAARLTTLEHTFVIGHKVDGTRDFGEHFLSQRWEETHPAGELESLAPSADDLAQIQFTSGTTGEPKGVMHTYNTLYAATLSVPYSLGIGKDDVVLMASTLAHQTGFLYGLLMPVSLGMKAVYQDVWEPNRMLELVDEERVTWTMGATPYVIDTVAAYKERSHDISSLRYFSSAGAPIPPHLVREMRALGTQLTAIWGMTENGAVAFTRPSDPLEFASTSDGRPVPWMELQVVGETGDVAQAGAVGGLRARGASQFVGYFKRPDLFAAVHDDEGWFDTGDLARMDTTGAIRIDGRARDLIIRGGENIPVVEIESALYALPAIKDIAIVAVPDPRLGERACAVVVPNGVAPTLDDIRSHLRSLGMTTQYWPEFLEIVEELPRTPSGKVQKFKLREHLESTAMRTQQA